MQNILAFVELDENKEIPKNKSVAYELMIEEEYKEKHKENKTEIVKEIKHIHSPQKKNEENPENIEYDYDPFQSIKKIKSICLYSISEILYYKYVVSLLLIKL